MKRLREVLGSFLSVAAGILACCLTWGFALFLASVWKEGILKAATIGFVYAFYVLVIGGALALATWVAAFVWIYLFVPRNSPLWKWPLCMLCGGIAGGLSSLAVILPYGVNIWGPALFFGGSGVVVGAVTCLFAALTAHHFKKS